jgi:aspartyl-tRNA(Asn)/glutamyl-tRNA(Gln) amidotransferase subunit B
MPADRRATVAAASGMAPDSDPVVTVVRLDLDPLLNAAVAAGADGELAVKRLANEVAASLEQAAGLDPTSFAALIGMESRSELTPAQARTVLKELLEQGGDPADIARTHGFEAMDAGALDAVLDEVIAANPSEWERFMGGEDKVQGFLIGKIKAATGGNADLKAASALLRSRRG